MAKNKKHEEIDIDEVLDGFDEASPDGKLPRLRDGDYTGLKIDMTMMKPTFFGPAFIIEMTLLGKHEPAEEGGPRDRTGKKVGYAIHGFGDPKRAERAHGNMKSFIAAALKADPNGARQWTKIAKRICKDNTLSGTDGDGFSFVVDAVVATKETKSGHEFVAVNWRESEFEHVAADSGEEE